MTDLKRQLEQEIADTERRLTFWRTQDDLLATTDLGPQTHRIVNGYELQLKELQRARKLLGA